MYIYISRVSSSRTIDAKSDEIETNRIIDAAIINKVHDTTYNAVFIFPYRNREKHKGKIIEYLGNYTLQRFPGSRFVFLFAEQDDDPQIRSIAMTASLLVNTIKMYETDR